jgi:uncharacterized membrane protein
MNTRRTLILCGLLTLAACIYSATMAGRLPDIVPTHWNAAGQPNDYGSKWTTLLLMPMIMAVMTILVPGLAAASPDKFGVESFRSTYNYVMLLVVAMMGVLHVTILQATVNGSFDITKASGLVIFAFFTLTGNVLGKVRRNFWMGIRTPWTLADERVWDQTHRVAAWLWTVGGVIGMLVCISGVSISAWITFLLVLAFIPVVYSFLLYQRLRQAPS